MAKSRAHLHRHLADRRARHSTTLIDRLMMITAIVYPLTGVPQAVQIFATHDASGVSWISWVAFLIFDFIELWYGFAHRLRPLILSGILWVIVELVIVVGIIIYS